MSDAQPQTSQRSDVDQLLDVWRTLEPEEQLERFAQLDRESAVQLMQGLTVPAQAALLIALPPGERRIWLRLLAPDDAADVIQNTPPERRAELIELLDDITRSEVTALLAYVEDEAGGLMNTRFARVRPDMRVAEALRYLRRQAVERTEAIYYAYVLGPGQELMGVISFKELLLAPDDQLIVDIMHRDVLSVPETMDQEEIARVIARRNLLAVPVVDSGGRIKGIVTIDDVVDVLAEEATEDIHKLGGMEALDLPYWRTSFVTLVRKRAGWLVVLFLGEMLTATAMARFEADIARAVVLAVFIPLIISSGGNSGSQATTLVVRAMALGEVRLHEIFRVFRRELAAGVALGAILGTIGMTRVMVWEQLFGSYGEHASLLAMTVALSVVGVVAWGALAGAMLPFALRTFKFDPASASAPLVATLVDVSGLVIYFNIAQWLLRGTLL
jgi:magnesium transporter